MNTIKLNGHTASNGNVLLEVDIPTEFPESDVEIEVNVRLLEKAREPVDSHGWPIGFFERTYGCLADDPIERPPQGEYEVREPLL